MFMHRNGAFDGKDRDSDGELFSEFVTTFGLLLTIFGGVHTRAEHGSVKVSVDLRRMVLR